MIDHLIYLDPDLDRAIATFERDYGIAPEPGGSHAGFGTRNALVGLGEGCYLELMALDPRQDVPAHERFFALDTQTTPRFAAWCARASRPLEQTVKIAREAGYDPGEILAMSRARADGSGTLAWTLTSPFTPREGGVLPFYIDWGERPSPGATLMPRLSLLSLTLVHPEAARIRAVLGALGEDAVRVETGPEPALSVVLATGPGR